MAKKKEFEWNKVDWRELKDIHGNSFQKDIYVQLPRIGEASYMQEGELDPFFLNDSDFFQYEMYYGLKSGKIKYTPHEKIEQEKSD